MNCTDKDDKGIDCLNKCNKAFKELMHFFFAAVDVQYYSLLSMQQVTYHRTANSHHFSPGFVPVQL